MKPIWTGLLSFGLINIPVKLYSGAEERALKFKLLHKDDFCPIGYEKVCKTTGEKIPYKDIVRGYEVEKNQYVILNDEDFKKANAEKTETIELVSFTGENNIAPLYYERPYFVEPEARAAKAYLILREALKKTGLVGIGKYVFREKEHIGSISVLEDSLILNQMRYKSEIREMPEFQIPRKAKPEDKEIKMAVSLIKQMEEDFRPEKFKDTYRNELLALIRAKAKGKVPAQKGTPKAETKDMDSLLEQLRKSLEIHEVNRV